MEGVSFQGLAIVAAVGFPVPLLLGFVPRLRVPSVVAEIAVGAILGPAVLGWVHLDEPIRIFAQLGMASLLFLAGMEIELDRLRGGLLRIALRGILISLGLSAAFCYSLQALGLLQSPLFVAIILSSSAIGIVIPLLKDAGEMGTPFGQAVIVGMSIADFGTVLLLTLLFSAGGGGPLKTLVLLIVVGLLCFLVATAAGSLRRWERLSKTLERLQDTTAMIRVRGAALLLILFVVLVEHIGLELMLGAFAAGALLGHVDRDWQATHPQFQMRLQAVGFGIFIPAFFVASGMQLDLRALFAGGPDARHGPGVFRWLAADPRRTGSGLPPSGRAAPDRRGRFVASHLASAARRRSAHRRRVGPHERDHRRRADQRRHAFHADLSLRRARPVAEEIVVMAEQRLDRPPLLLLSK